MLTFYHDGNVVRVAGAPVRLFGRDLLAQQPGDLVCVHEGEKCRKAAMAIPSWIPVCWNGGGKKAKLVDWSPLRGRTVSIYPDDDAPGLETARTVARALTGIASSVRIVAPLEEARALKAKGADIVEALQVRSPQEMAEYLGSGPELAVEESSAVCADDRQSAVGMGDLLDAEGGGPGHTGVAEARRILRPILTEAQCRSQDLSLEAAELTEAAAAHDFARMFAGSLLWVKGSGWRIYDADFGAWIRDRDSLIASRCAVFAAEAKRRRIGLASDPRAAERFVRALLTRRGVHDIVELAKSEPVMQANRSEFDQDPDVVLDAAGKHIELRTGQVRPAAPKDRHTKRLGVALDPEAKAERFEAVLAEVLPDIKDRSYLQRTAGYFMTGRTTEQVLFFNTGLGQNGKGTVFHPIEKCLGDYGATAPSSYVAPTSKSGKPEVQNARLEGIRAVFIRETELGAHLDEGTVKNLTGGDPIPAEAKYEAPYDYVPQFKLNIETNNAPKIRDRSKGTWRRIRRLPWDVTIPDERVDTRLGEKLEGEFPGILLWMIRGAVAWYAGGLQPSEHVLLAGIEYKRATDTLGDFLDGYVIEQAASIKTGTLSDEYRTWADKQGIKKRHTPGQFKEAMIQRGFYWKHAKTPPTTSVSEHARPQTRSKRSILRRPRPSRGMVMDKYHSSTALTRARVIKGLWKVILVRHPIRPRTSPA